MKVVVSAGSWAYPEISNGLPYCVGGDSVASWRTRDTLVGAQAGLNVHPTFKPYCAAVTQQRVAGTRGEDDLDGQRPLQDLCWQP